MRSHRFGKVSGCVFKLSCSVEISCLPSSYCHLDCETSAHILSMDAAYKCFDFSHYILVTLWALFNSAISSNHPVTMDLKKMLSFLQKTRSCGCQHQLKAYSHAPSCIVLLPVSHITEMHMIPHLQLPDNFQFHWSVPGEDKRMEMKFTIIMVSRCSLSAGGLSVPVEHIWRVVADCTQTNSWSARALFSTAKYYKRTWKHSGDESHRKITTMVRFGQEVAWAKHQWSFSFLNVFSCAL